MEQVYLYGSEDVRNASQTMRAAADKMGSAASSIQYAFEHHQRYKAKRINYIHMYGGGL